MYIVDSTTISLFSDILKGAGRNPLNGKKKGGIKMHTMINASEDVPSLVVFTSAATHDHVFFVTRMKDNAVYESLQEHDIADDIENGVIKDEKIKLEKDTKIIELKRIAYWSEEQKKVFEFITNNYELSADKIAEIYKRSWQIELLFKRLKQNFPLKYFLGDTQNAIEIQIWVCLIVQLQILVIQKTAERKWAYSNLMSII